MAKKRTTKNKGDRIAFRAEPAWTKAVETEASRLGLSVSAYLRVAAVEKMDRDRQQRDAKE